MLRRPLVLAAVADSAVPGLLPVRIEGEELRLGAHYQEAVVTDEEDRHWRVRSALNAAAGAAMDTSEALTALLRPRLDVELPSAAGILDLPDGGTVGVYPMLPGRPLDWHRLEARSAEARAVGHFLAAVHDLDPRVYEEAGVPTYDADEYRTRRLAELDRAAATRHVPAALLGRWERALEDVALWRFPALPTHGSLDDGDVYVREGAVTAVDNWFGACISDPARDFAPLFMQAAPDAVDTVVESYAAARKEQPDVHLSRRIRLSSEMQYVTDLLDAIALKDDELVRECAGALHRLAEQTEGDESLVPRPIVRRAPVTEDSGDEDLDDAPDDDQGDEASTGKDLAAPQELNESEQELKQDVAEEPSGETADRRETPEPRADGVTTIDPVPATSTGSHAANTATDTDSSADDGPAEPDAEGQAVTAGGDDRRSTRGEDDTQDIPIRPR